MRRLKKKSGGKTKPNNPNAMLAQVQQMQEDMAKAQEALENEFITVTAGGGDISIEISGHQRVKTITVEEDLLDPEEKEMLQDMLVAAVNQAIEQSQAMAAERMEGISSGVSGLNDMLGGLGLGL
ncbi:MAG: YbaB/EbfC family nucleoid-associated protein [Anaerolineales bacterium]|nr:YbaB/EbfC family nucleoid-associated protein [Anaerolineales bacterium]